MLCSHSIIAWVWDGAVYCPDCAYEGDPTPDDEEFDHHGGPIFPSDPQEDLHCHACNCFLDPETMDWEPV